MDTVLFTLGPMHIYAYGTMLSLGYGAAVVLALREARRRDWACDMMLNYLIWGFVVGLLAARVLFVLCELPYFIAFPEELLSISTGLSGFGALLGFAGVTIWAQKETKWDYRQLADVLAAPVALASAIASIGTSRVGRVTELTLAVVSDGLGFHPLGAYRAVGCYLTFVAVWGLRRRAKFPGQLGILTAFGLGLTQLTVGFFDDHPLAVWKQLLGFLVMVAVFLLVRFTALTTHRDEQMEHFRLLPPTRAPWYRRISWVWGLVILLGVYYWRAIRS